MFIKLTDTVGSISAESITKTVIDLNGPEGNAFHLLGVAKQIGKKLELDTDKIRKEMMSQDYVHLVATFEYYFGSIFYLILTEELQESQVYELVQFKEASHV